MDSKLVDDSFGGWEMKHREITDYKGLGWGGAGRA